MKTTGKILKPNHTPSNAQAEKVMFPAFAKPVQRELPVDEPSAIITEPVVQKTRPAPSNNQTSHSEQDRQEGFRSGYQQGITKGQEDGYKQGFAEGTEAGLKQGHEQGYQKGLEEGTKAGADQGYQQGMERSRQDMDFLSGQMNQQLSQIRNLSLQHRQQLSELLTQVIETAVSHITRVEMRNRPEQIHKVIEDTLEQLPDHHGRYQVHLNPVDSERLIQLHPEIRERWTIISAPEVAPGDCYIEAEHSEAESSHKQRMQDCLEQVRQHLPSELEKILV
ncbi:FliH/SctL family protein [Parendozoicomonas haliclonae]|uniref:Flagellar assembly protein FliH n=1 Tax=Parendozoicomonas haliclonae TaxID=1960125 RepID=A0A1X7AGQ9_9GAMM|nr:FliH/SctL family protein [Parendozoicomonas haliclonae]SMA39696.1 flagellar assembly protein H [Parendozoicomonas haliclonae]